MPIDHFTQEQFESALPVNKLTGDPIWSPCGLIQGEYQYQIPVKSITHPLSHRDHGITDIGIIIRSSIDASGFSASTGEDSIRIRIADLLTGEPYGSKLTHHITRVPGWQKRMTEQLRLLYKLASALKPCSVCGEMRKAFKVKADTESKGRFFQKCGRQGCQDKRSFEWIDVK